MEGSIRCVFVAVTEEELEDAAEMGQVKSTPPERDVGPPAINRHSTTPPTAGIKGGCARITGTFCSCPSSKPASNMKPVSAKPTLAVRVLKDMWRTVQRRSARRTQRRQPTPRQRLLATREDEDQEMRTPTSTTALENVPWREENATNPSLPARNNRKAPLHAPEARDEASTSRVSSRDEVLPNEDLEALFYAVLCTARKLRPHRLIRMKRVMVETVLQLEMEELFGHSPEEEGEDGDDGSELEDDVFE